MTVLNKPRREAFGKAALAKVAGLVIGLEPAREETAPSSRSRLGG